MVCFDALCNNVHFISSLGSFAMSMTEIIHHVLDNISLVRTDVDCTLLFHLVLAVAQFCNRLNF